MAAFKIANIFALIFRICHSTQKGRVNSYMYYLEFTSQQDGSTKGLASVLFRTSKLLRIEQDGFQVLQIKTTVCFLMRVIGLNSLLFIHTWPTKGHLLNTPSDIGCVSRYLFIFPACQTAFCLCHRLFCL